MDYLALFVALVVGLVVGYRLALRSSKKKFNRALRETASRSAEVRSRRWTASAGFPPNTPPPPTRAPIVWPDNVQYDEAPTVAVERPDWGTE